MQFRNPARHRTRVPVLEDSSRAQPQRVFRVRLLRRRLVRALPDDGLVAQRMIPVEGEARSFGDIGVGTLAIAPARFSPVDHRPTQAARALEVVVLGDVFADSDGELPVFLIEAAGTVFFALPGEEFAVTHALGDLDCDR